MTPEERADAIVKRYADGTEDWSDEVAFIAGHIRAAVVDEREACAQVAEEWHMRRLVILEHPDQYGDPPPAGPRIAAAIRARAQRA